MKRAGPNSSLSRVLFRSGVIRHGIARAGAQPSGCSFNCTAWVGTQFGPVLKGALVGMLAAAWPLLAAEPSAVSAPVEVKQSSAPPPLPVGKSPVDIFREMLAQNPSERAEFLSKRTPESRALILAKLREYESLSPEESALRLEVTELRWYLLPLMKMPQGTREQQVDTIPSTVRTLVQERLQRWDRLPVEAQKQVLENEDVRQYYFECAVKTGDEVAAASPANQASALTEEQRQAMRNGLQQFFLLTSQEKSKILHTLSDPERKQIAKTLQTFDNLNPAQRGECLRSFEKFASLTAQERQQFLKSAEQWNKMSPSERHSWKELVYKLSRLPPIPPGLGFPPLPGPLQPNAGGLPSPARAIATNAPN